MPRGGAIAPMVALQAQSQGGLSSVAVAGAAQHLIDPAIDAHHGRIVKRTGDGIIIDFRSVVDAVRVVFIGTTTKSPV
jgi:class 3 adenylate cyclase